jgi:hypothetical protein
MKSYHHLILPLTQYASFIWQSVLNTFWCQVFWALLPLWCLHSQGQTGKKKVNKCIIRYIRRWFVLGVECGRDRKMGQSAMLDSILSGLVRLGDRQVNSCIKHAPVIFWVCSMQRENPMQMCPTPLKNSRKVSVDGTWCTGKRAQVADRWSQRANGKERWQILHSSVGTTKMRLHYKSYGDPLQSLLHFPFSS